MKIKFSHNYYKLHNQTKAQLISVKSIVIDKDTPSELLEYDTTYDGGRYELKNGDYVMLVFLGNLGIPFTTIRSAKGRWLVTVDKEYDDRFGCWMERIAMSHWNRKTKKVPTWEEILAFIISVLSIVTFTLLIVYVVAAKMRMDDRIRAMERRTRELEGKLETIEKDLSGWGIRRS